MAALCLVNKSRRRPYLMRILGGNLHNNDPRVLSPVRPSSQCIVRLCCRGNGLVSDSQDNMDVIIPSWILCTVELV